MAFGLTLGEGVALASAAAGAYSASKAGKGSQGGTQTTSNQPWAPAQPWMQQNLKVGQNLQQYYQANPFNQQQVQAYGNLASGNDYINRMTPGLLQQFSQQGGFDRNNPSAKPQAFSFLAPNSVNPQQAQSFGGIMGQAAPAGVQETTGAAFYGNPSTPTTPKLNNSKMMMLRGG